MQKTKNLCVFVDIEKHRHVKAHAAQKGITIKEYIEGLIDRDMCRQEHSMPDNNMEV